MRVLHILDELKPSGAEEMLRSNASWFRSQGVQADVLATGARVGPYAPVLSDAGYGIHHEPFSKHPRFVRSVHDLIRAGDYDVVHIHPERGSILYATACALAARGRRRGPRRLRTVHHIFPWTGRLRMQKAAERAVMRHVLGVRFVSNSPSGQRNEASTFWNHNPIVPNWYDDAHFVPPTDDRRAERRRSLGVADDELALVTLGGCWSYKNHDLVLRALALLPDDLRVRYLHAGAEADGHPERALAAELGVADRCTFLGVVDDPLDVLHAADLYAMPSSAEGFGIAAVEAMACGVPAVLSDVAALWDFKHTIPGICWIDLTPSSIAAAILECASKPPAERRSWGLEQAGAVADSYGVAVGASAYLQLYRGGTLCRHAQT